MKGTRQRVKSRPVTQDRERPLDDNMIQHQEEVVPVATASCFPVEQRLWAYDSLKHILSPLQKDVFKLRYIHLKTQVQIAYLLQVSQAMVCYVLRRVKLVYRRWTILKRDYSFLIQLDGFLGFDSLVVTYAIGNPNGEASYANLAFKRAQHKHKLKRYRKHLRRFK